MKKGDNIEIYSLFNTLYIKSSIKIGVLFSGVIKSNKKDNIKIDLNNKKELVLEAYGELRGKIVAITLCQNIFPVNFLPEQSVVELLNKHKKHIGFVVEWENVDKIIVMCAKTKIHSYYLSKLKGDVLVIKVIEEVSYGFYGIIEELDNMKVFVLKSYSCIIRIDIYNENGWVGQNITEELHLVRGRVIYSWDVNNKVVLSGYTYYKYELDYVKLVNTERLKRRVPSGVELSKSEWGYITGCFLGDGSWDTTNNLYGGGNLKLTKGFWNKGILHKVYHQRGFGYMQSDSVFGVEEEGSSSRLDYVEKINEIRFKDNFKKSSGGYQEDKRATYRDRASGFLAGFNYKNSSVSNSSEWGLPIKIVRYSNNVIVKYFFLNNEWVIEELSSEQKKTVATCVVVDSFVIFSKYLLKTQESFQKKEFACDYVVNNREDRVWLLFKLAAFIPVDSRFVRKHGENLEKIGVNKEMLGTGLNDIEESTIFLGLFDTDGSVGLDRQKMSPKIGDNKRGLGYVQISFCNNDYTLVNMFHKKFGGSISKKSNDTSEGGASYTWRIRSKNELKKFVDYVKDFHKQGIVLNSKKLIRIMATSEFLEGTLSHSKFLYFVEKETVTYEELFKYFPSWGSDWQGSFFFAEGLLNQYVLEKRVMLDITSQHFFCDDSLMWWKKKLGSLQNKKNVETVYSKIVSESISKSDSVKLERIEELKKELEKGEMYLNKLREHRESIGTNKDFNRELVEEICVEILYKYHWYTKAVLKSGDLILIMDYMKTLERLNPSENPYDFWLELTKLFNKEYTTHNFWVKGRELSLKYGTDSDYITYDEIVRKFKGKEFLKQIQEGRKWTYFTTQMIYMNVHPHEDYLSIANSKSEDEAVKSLVHKTTSGVKLQNFSKHNDIPKGTLIVSGINSDEEEVDLKIDIKAWVDEKQFISV